MLYFGKKFIFLHYSRLNEVYCKKTILFRVALPISRICVFQ
ncbi:hypothetical protein FORC11_p0094 (plasmid) [Shigella sonnei]|nr:hypothetical protein FORC11_p0094 [Shigella sonnei]